MKLEGRAHKFGDDVNTDYIISGRYKFATLNVEELAQHVMEDLDPEFYKKIKSGDFIVAGKNFGCGSSREQAPIAIKAVGVGAVLAKSFARIFYRNAINVGLPVVECDTDGIEAGDEVVVDLKSGVVKNKTKKTEIKVMPLPEVMMEVLAGGGLIKYIKSGKRFK